MQGIPIVNPSWFFNDVLGTACIALRQRPNIVMITTKSAAYLAFSICWRALATAGISSALDLTHGQVAKEKLNCSDLIDFGL
jgi:hypothetical protein